MNNKEPSDPHEETNATQAHDGRPPNHSASNGTSEAAEEGATEHESEQRGEEPQQQEVRGRRRQTENEVSEVEIPNVGRIMVRADADGYNEEVSGESDNVQFYPKLKPRRNLSRPCISLQRFRSCRHFPLGKRFGAPCCYLNALKSSSITVLEVGSSLLK